MRNTKSLMGGLATVAGLALCAVPAAFASHGSHGGGVRVAGTCTKASTSKLKLSNENGRIQVEFEVDQNRIGRKWAVVLRHNGVVVRRMAKVTQAPSGSFEARILTANAAGADRFVASATRTGETCTARASF